MGAEDHAAVADRPALARPGERHAAQRGTAAAQLAGPGGAAVDGAEDQPRGTHHPAGVGGGEAHVQQILARIRADEGPDRVARGEVPDGAGIADGPAFARRGEPHALEVESGVADLVLPGDAGVGGRADGAPDAHGPAVAAVTVEEHPVEGGGGTARLRVPSRLREDEDLRGVAQPARFRDQQRAALADARHAAGEVHREDARIAAAPQEGGLRDRRPAGVGRGGGEHPDLADLQRVDRGAQHHAGQRGQHRRRRRLAATGGEQHRQDRGDQESRAEREASGHRNAHEPPARPGSPGHLPFSEGVDGFPATRGYCKSRATATHCSTTG